MYFHNNAITATTAPVESNGWGDPDIGLRGVTERVTVNQQRRTVEIHIRPT
jgi:hypothetical protein